MDTSWETVAKWYDKLVGSEGHYFHREIIFPHLIPLFHFEEIENPGVLDVASGSGILAEYIPKEVGYLGIELSKSLVSAAEKRYKRKFQVQDACKPFLLKGKTFSHATIILALQNMDHPKTVFRNVHRHLLPGGKLFIVLNHPCFRIPRQTHWGIDQKQKIQYRRIDRYLSPLKIPIQMQPSKKEKSHTTHSFHYPISSYVQFLREEGFMISGMQEWASDKASMGKLAKMENRAREEFPLFLMIEATAESS